MDAQLKREIASITEDYLYFTGILGSRQLNPNPVLRTRGSRLGLALYDKIEEDSHAYAVIDKRKRAATLCATHVVAASDSPLDQRVAEFVREQLDNLAIPSDDRVSELGLKGFDGVRFCQLDAILKGYSVAESIWDTGYSQVAGGMADMCDRILPKPQRMFAFAYGERGWELRFLTRDRPYEGIAVPQRKFIVYTFGDKEGNPYGSGLGERLFWNVFFKRQDIQFWLRMAEIVSKRVAVGKFPSTVVNEEEKKILLEAVQNIQDGTGAIIPEGMLLEVLDVVQNGGDTHEKLCRYLDEQTSECVLGETGTTNQQGSGGSRARDEVGNEVRLETRNSDCDLLNETWNRTVIRWISRNFSAEANPPRLERIGDPEDLNVRAVRDRQFFDMGFRLNLEKFTEIYGEGYELVQAPQIPVIPPSGANNAPEFAENTDSVIETLVSQQVRAYKTKVVHQIESLAENSSDFSEFTEGLPQVYED